MLLRYIIRLLAFFNKEIAEVARQPKLVLSLVLGPFLILLLFGIGYSGDRPKLRTALVLPADQMDNAQLDQIKQGIQANFTLVSTDSDLDGAMRRLQNNELDVVEIVPADMQQRIERGEQGVVTFKYNEINPLNESWIQYLAYAQVKELNSAVLESGARDLQSQSGQTKTEITQLRQQLDTLNAGMTGAQREQTQQTVRRLRDSAGVFASSPVIAAQVAAGDQEARQTQTNLLQLQQDLDTIDKAMSDGTIAQQQERINATRERLAVLEDATNRFSSMSPTVIVSPLTQNYENIRGKSYDFMTFYAPAVVALILQHIAVTLGALSLVRERLLGAMEFYGVAPVSMGQVLAGKYLAYTLFIAVIGAVLIGLMLTPWLAIPFNGDPFLFAGLLVLFTIASLGIGFFISAISSSDSQAVQLSMLVLLLSIFFSGFFLPLENFTAYVRPFGYILPLTHGISGFQNIMLRGIAPTLFAWSALAAIAAVAALLVNVIWRRQFRRVT